MVQNLFSISSFFKIKFMFKHIFYAVLFLLSATTTQCSKTSTTPDDSNTLPPETQTGAGTFACKINGVVWKYKNPNYEFLSTKPVTRWEFDKSNMGGYLTINGLRYPDGINSSDLLFLQADSLLISKEKVVNNYYGYNFGIVYKDYLAPVNKCDEFKTTSLDTTKNYFSSGKLTISKLDQTVRIIAGTFNATIKQAGCDTLKITEGRFDLKF